MSGSQLTAVGFEALKATTTGSNIAVGHQALVANETGGNNTAVGMLALVSNVSGSDNTAIGHRAGMSATGSDNVYINNLGVIGESNTTRIGNAGDHGRTFIAGIRGVTTGLADAISVLVDANGQLGTVSSSRRYKEDIRDMADTSRLLDLRPVTFRYRQAYTDGSTPIQYGLIAEEVAEVYPDLVVYAGDGQAETVQYRKVNAMLLNELQRQFRRRHALVGQLEALLARVAELEGE